MPNSAARVISTAVMWLICGAIAIAAIFASDGDLGSTMPVIGSVMLAATAASFFVWGGTEALAGSSASQAKPEAESYEKAKRQSSADSRMKLLLEMMSDDERAAFKDGLRRQVLEDMRGSSDGELPTGLDALLNAPREKRL